MNDERSGEMVGIFAQVDDLKGDGSANGHRASAACRVPPPNRSELHFCEFKDSAHYSLRNLYNNKFDS